MELNDDFLEYRRPQLRTLAEGQLYRIHLASLRILERTGG